MDIFIEILKAVLFGIVEGITEWLPISSTGHMILLDEFIKLKVTPDFYEMFQVVIQLGAIAAVIALFFHKLNPFSAKKDSVQKKDTWNLWFKVVVAVLPSAVIGLLLDDWLEANVFKEEIRAWVVAIALIAYGVAFILVERQSKGKARKIKNINEIDYRTALLMGAFQCLSLIPGTSRSGSTILGGILLGVSRVAASEFSFFMAIPTMLGASALKLLKFILGGFNVGALDIAILLTGCVVSFVVSLLVIKALMKYVRSHSFASFGVYRIVLGALVLIYFAVKLIFF